MKKLCIVVLLMVGCVPTKPIPLAHPDVAPPARTAAAESRRDCLFERGAFPGETVGEGLPVGDDIPIDHIIVLMLENRSYDHYFSDDLPLGDLCGPSHNHSWIGTHVRIRDGFPEETQTRVNMPYYRALYGEFASSDRHFSALPGPTWPNRYYLLAGTSFGMIENGVAPPRRVKSGIHIFEVLDRRDISWGVYYTDVPFALGAFPTYSALYPGRFKRIRRLHDDLAEGTIPNFVLVEPGYIGPRRTDEHAPTNPEYGQRATARLVKSVMGSPLWERTALIITYDEHGGFSDRVRPPAACDPGDYPVPEGNPGNFGQRGFRVPLVVVSPWARRGYVSHRVTDAASILRFIEARFDLPALTKRDANAWPLLDMLDFDSPPRVEVPELPEAAITTECDEG